MALPWSVTMAVGGSGAAGKSLLLMEPHSVLSKPQPLLVRGTRREAVSGAAYTDTAATVASARFEFQFVCETRAAYAFLRDFFDAMEGRRGTFFFPTWQWELNVGSYSTFLGASVISLPESAHFADVFYPMGMAYRYLALLWSDRASVFRATAVGVGAPPAGFQSVLLGAEQDINGGISGSVSAPWIESTGVRPLWLRYGRFDTDEFNPENDVNGDGAAIVTLPVVDLPDEANTWT